MGKELDKQGPLAGIRVLDLGRVLAAPFATQLLADMGADIIKVERPGAGDDARYYGPESLKGAGARDLALGAMFISANRNKKSVSIDFSTPEGSQLVKDLAAISDCFVENFLPGQLARYGLDYDSVRAINPGIIYCSLTGYGQFGPKRNRPGYDAVFQAEGGLMAVTGLPEEEAGSCPVKVGPSIVDATTGLYASNAIMAALVERQRSGLGQLVDVSLLETVIAIQTSHVQNYLLSGTQPRRRGNGGNGGHPAGTFECMDGTIYVSPGSKRDYQNFCNVLGLRELGDDPRYATALQRFNLRHELNAILNPVIARWHVNALLDALVAAEVACAPINGYQEVFADEQVRALDVRRRLDSPVAENGYVDVVASPIRMSRTPLSYRSAPPTLGEHTDLVLRDLLGLTQQDVDGLRRRKVI